jgi:hypothetical protein
VNQTFLKSWWNWFDLVCMSAVVTLLVVYIMFTRHFGAITVELETDDMISLSIMVVRFTIQTIRTAGTLKQ